MGEGGESPGGGGDRAPPPPGGCGDCCKPKREREPLLSSFLNQKCRLPRLSEFWSVSAKQSNLWSDRLTIDVRDALFSHSTHILPT